MIHFNITDTTNNTTYGTVGYTGLERTLKDMFLYDLDAYQGRDDNGETYTTRDIIHHIVLSKADGDDTADLEAMLGVTVTKVSEEETNVMIA